MLEYIERHMSELKAKRAGDIYIFTCPFCGGRALTIKNSEKARCSKCGRVFGIDVFQSFSILDFYKKLGWSLVKITPKEKKPIEPKWQNRRYTDLEVWKDWLKNGFNIGVNLGLSGLTVIDFDDEEVFNELKDKFNKTLIQKTTHGYHLFYKSVKISNSNLRPKYAIEVRGVGQQVVVEPSVTNAFKRYFVEQIEPQEMSSDTKEFLIKQVKNKSIIRPKINYEEAIVPEGRRHYDLISAGGHFKNLGFSPKQIRNILFYINKRYYIKPKPVEEINHICNSLYGYQLSEEEEAKREIIDYLEKAKEATKVEIEIVLFGGRVRGIKKKKLDELLVQLIRERRIYKERQSYKIAVDAGWSDDLSLEVNKPLDFQVPYLYDVSNFMLGDVILINAKTGMGKTHFAINICKKLSEQGIKPYLLETEPTKRFLRIAHQVGLNRNQFYFNKEVINPITVEFADSSVNIIDWLDPANAADFTQTSRIFNHLNEQGRRHNAIFIVFMQLRNDEKQFAKDLVNQYPSLVVNFLLEEDRIHGKLKVLKNNDPKFPYVFEIPTIFNQETKLLERADAVSKNMV